MDEIRVTFSKNGKAKYISHLDLNRAMQRALKRSNIPVWYTMGFNPHAYIMFPLALSLGVDSDCELMDFSLEEAMPFEIIKSNLNNVLPEGLKIIAVALQEKKHTEIVKSQYEIIMKCDISPELALEKLSLYLLLEKIEIEKRTKRKGLNLIDIKPMLEIVNKEISQDCLKITLTLPAGTQSNINPTLFTDTFQSYMKIVLTSISIKRTKILCDNDEIFA